jgi:hypothetical protein
MIAQVIEVWEKKASRPWYADVAPEIDYSCPDDV